MSEHLGLGKLIADNYTGVDRDAVHVAVIAVYAKERLDPGAHVAVDVTSGTAYMPYMAYRPGTRAGSAPTIGIVDPFLDEEVYAGDRFWLYLYPGSINSLSHQWTHSVLDAEPFPKEVEKVFVKTYPDTDSEDVEELSPTKRMVDEAKQYLTEFGEQYGVSYDQLIESAHNYLDNGEYYYGPRDSEDGWGGFSGGEYIDDPETFWHHFQTVTGRYVEKGSRENYFTCSC